MAGELVVLVTVPSREKGEEIASAVVGARLAACVNIVGPILSVYRWEGQLSRDEEHLLIMKTTADSYDALQARVLALHPYETPEVIALPIVAGAPGYLAWLRGNAGGEKE